MVDTTRTGSGRLTSNGILNAWIFMMLFRNDLFVLCAIVIICVVVRIIWILVV